MTHLYSSTGIAKHIVMQIPDLFKLITVVIIFAVASLTASATDLISIHQQARENDPVFKRAAAAQQMALESRQQSQAQLLPTLVFNAQISDYSQDVISGTALLFARKSQGYSLTLTQPIYHRENFVRLDQADAEIAQAKATFAAAEQELIIRTAQLYFDALAAKDNLDFSRAEKNALERQLEQTRQRFDVGLIAITDVHEARAAYDLVAAQDIEAENLLNSQFEALHELTNHDYKNLAVLGDTLELVSPDPADINSWSQQALNNNLALLAQHLATQIAQDNIKISRAGHFPQLDLNANHTYADSSGGNFGARETRDNTVSLQLTVPLYQGGAVQSQTRLATAQYDQAVETLEQQKRSTIRQARDGYRGVLAATKRVNALLQAVISAQSALKASQAGLEVGTRTTVDVLEARRNLYRAQRNLARARYDYILFSLQLKQVSGQLQLSDLEHVNRWLQ